MLYPLSYGGGTSARTSAKSSARDSSLSLGANISRLLLDGHRCCSMCATYSQA